jgi:hypothetical protein
MDLARDAHRAGDSTKAGAALNEVKESVELCYESLVERRARIRASTPSTFQSRRAQDPRSAAAFDLT